MYPIYKQMLGLQAYQALTKFPQIPAANLAVGETEVLHSIPLLIFTKQQLPAAKPVIDSGMHLPYEKTAAKGAGDTLTLNNFVTDDFGLGKAYGSV